MLHPTAGSTLVYHDGGVTLVLKILSAAALPSGTTICFYKGDLGALAALFPAGQTLLHAYAVLWHGPSGNLSPTASPPITFTVTGAVIDDGNPIYDISTGTPVAVGTASGGGWSVSFANDPLFVATGPVPAAPTPSPAPTANSPTSAASAPTAVVAVPRTTG